MRNIPFQLSEALSNAAEAPVRRDDRTSGRNTLFFILVVVAVAIAVGAAAWVLL